MKPPKTLQKEAFTNYSKRNNELKTKTLCMGESQRRQQQENYGFHLSCLSLETSTTEDAWNMKTGAVLNS